MDKKILEQIKGRLSAEKNRLEIALKGFAVKDKEINDNFKSRFPDFGDKEDENAAEVSTFSDNLSLEHTLENDLRDVNKALERIKKGDYGICKYCHQEIEVKRLMIRPTSSSCVECKKKLKGE